MAQVLDNLSTNDVAVGTWLVPAEKARALSYRLPFPNSQGGTDYVVDLLNAFERGSFTTFQYIYIDNSLNAASFSMTVDQTGQVITAAPKTQGYYPVQAPMPCALHFVSTGTAIVVVQLINVPVPSTVWGTAAGGGTFVQDVILEDAITGASPGTAASSAEQVAGIFNAAGVTVPDGDSVALQVDSKGNLKVSASLGNAALYQTSLPAYTVTGTPSPLFVTPNGQLQVQLCNGQNGSSPQNFAQGCDFVNVGAEYLVTLPTLTNASLCPLLVDVNGRLIVTDQTVDKAIDVIGASTASVNMMQVGGVYTLAIPTLTDGQSFALSLDFQGNVRTTDATLLTGRVSQNGSATTFGLVTAGYYHATPPTVTDGHGSFLQMDVQGDLMVRNWGSASGDVARPFFSGFKCVTLNQAVTATGATGTIFTATAGLFISSISVSSTLAGTTAGGIQVNIKDGANNIWLGFLPIGAGTAFVIYNIQSILEDYFATTSGTSITVTITGATGLSGQVAFTMMYAQTSFIGP